MQSSEKEFVLTSFLEKDTIKDQVNTQMEAVPRARCGAGRDAPVLSPSVPSPIPPWVLQPRSSPNPYFGDLMEASSLRHVCLY